MTDKIQIPIQSIFAEGHYHFFAEYANHKFFMQNPDGIVFMDGKPIITFIDGEYYINESGLLLGWMGFDKAIMVYCEIMGFIYGE